MKNKKYVYAFMSLVLLTTMAMAVPVLADTATPTTQPRGWGQGANRGMIRPVVFGTVSAVSGNIITVSGRQGLGTDATATIFTIDATNAKITKSNVAGTISSIVVGDTVMAQGTLTGTNLVATIIHDGQVKRGTRGNSIPPVFPITGNGQPVVAGTVSSVSGSTITITNKSNVSYTVDATNAKIVQGSNTISISNVAVGDTVVVQGTVNGNAVTASSVIDQTKPANTTATNSGTAAQPHQGFFAGIGSFFARIFGF